MYHKKNDKRSIESSKMIYDALVELISKKDYKSITIKEIVDQANIGRSTFYRNYDTIDDVLLKRCDEDFEKCISYMTNNLLLTNTNNETNLLSRFIYIFLSYWQIDSQILELLQHINRFDIIEASLYNIINMVLLHSVKEGHPIEHPEYFIALRLGVIKSVLYQWIKDGKKIPPHKLGDLIVRQLLLENSNLLVEFQETFKK